VRHLETGLVFPRGDVGALSQAMLTIASDPALRRSIGDAARHRAEARSMADMLTDYEQVLTQATARSRLRVAGLP
jgi:glycosyltransferase involved in cell wall biosynthesis